MEVPEIEIKDHAAPALAVDENDELITEPATEDKKEEA